MRNILITGINGFIGSYLARRLLEERYNIIGVSREDKCRLSEKIKYIKADITDFTAINSIFDTYTIDCVIHLAAIVHKKSNDLSYEAYYDVNYLASKNIFERCLEKNVKKVIFSSTIEVYGNNKESIVTENAKCMPKTIYGKTKLLAEDTAKLLLGRSSTDFAIMRFAPVYAKDFLLNIYNRIYLIHRKIAYYFKDGSYTFNFCSINNILEFVSNFLNNDSVPSGTYNISDGKNYSAMQLIKLEKEFNSLRIICRLPYHICLIAINIFEKVHLLLKKRDCTISVNNFSKLFRSTIYSNKNAEQLVTDLNWDIENTLYK